MSRHPPPRATRSLAWISKNSAANQIATQELMRIFENMQEKTVHTSKSVEDLITAQVATEIKSALSFLEKRTKSNPSHYFYKSVEALLQPGDSKCSTPAIKAAQEKMESVTSENYVDEIKKIVKEVIIDAYMRACGNLMKNVLADHQ
ncbi:hypothetical protein KCU65_g4354, partial [Aureobasidium melanogenum]